MLKCLIMFFIMLMALPVAAQTVTPGCVFTWEEPLVDDPANPGSQIGVWKVEGDLDGFQWVTNDVEVWDDLKMSLIEKDDRTVLCSTVGVVDLGDYVVMIRTYDTSNNKSLPAVLKFELVQVDTTPNTGIGGICAEWMLGDVPMKLCSN